MNEIQSGNSSIPSCPLCKSPIPLDAYFCPQCGKAIRQKPLPTSFGKQMGVYAISIFLPPFGLWYTWKYAKQKDGSSKRIAFISALLTIISLGVTGWALQKTFDSVNQTLNAFTNIPL